MSVGTRVEDLAWVGARRLWTICLHPITSQIWVLGRYPGKHIRYRVSWHDPLEHALSGVHRLLFGSYTG